MVYGELVRHAGQFQSTHPVRGATNGAYINHMVNQISIHAPREGCDLLRMFVLLDGIFAFQSTHPVRGATGKTYCRDCVPKFQSTHPVRGATKWERDGVQGLPISIHAPREGCDGNDGGHQRRESLFQSTHPVRGATHAAEQGVLSEVISIHAPREGCDCGGGTRYVEHVISIHAPREGCDRQVAGRIRQTGISIHAPREGCDEDYLKNGYCFAISIHAPREGCDIWCDDMLIPALAFQSTHPVRGATAGMDFASQDTDTPTTP